MQKNGFATIVLDHYSKRNVTGPGRREFTIKEAKKWRENDILDVLQKLKNNTRINKNKVILAGWSAGAGIVLPIISNPQKLIIPDDINIAGAILIYPYTYGCYETIESFNVPTLIIFGQLDGSKKPLTGIHCWKEKISKFKKNNHIIIFKTLDNSYHLFDFPMRKKKVCVSRKYKDGITDICYQGNIKAMKEGIIAMKQFLRKIIVN